jgi:hypothetical protein
MPDDRDEPRRRTIDPIVTGIGDGVTTGYRAVESVVLGFAESARLRAARPVGDPRRAPRAPRAARARSTAPPARAGRTRSSRSGGAAPDDMPPPVSIVGELADLTVDLLDGLGDVARDIAGRVAEHDRFEDDSHHHTISLEGVPGELVDEDFLLSNTGPSGLRSLTFATTDLIGSAPEPIPPDKITSTPKRGGSVDRVRPGGSATVTVSIGIPENAAPAVYHGCLTARFGAAEDRTDTEAGPVGAWALIELEVLAADPSRR